MFKSFFIFASDYRSYQDLYNVALEIKSRNLPYFFLYSTSSGRVDLKLDLSVFSYDTNIEFNDTFYEYKSLGFGIPFKPEVVIITNENWNPEKEILLEFKTKGAVISCVENSSWLYNNIKTKLELKSRQTFPSNCIDIFFEHSTWCRETKKLAGWPDFKSVVVGNPKYDAIKISKNSEEYHFIVYGSMEKEHHGKLLAVYSNIKNRTGNKGQVFYKPHPNELREFPDDFKNITLVTDEQEYLNLLPSVKYCIGLFTSVMYLPLLLGKNITYIDNLQSGVSEEVDLERFRGFEFDFWSRVLGFSSFEEFANFIDVSYIERTIKRNESLEVVIKENLLVYDEKLTFLGKESTNNNLIKYYDDFSDNKASKRIVDFLTSN